MSERVSRETQLKPDEIAETVTRLRIIGVTALASTTALYNESRTNETPEPLIAMIEEAGRDLVFWAGKLRGREERYQKVRAGFVLNGTSLTNWCRENGSHIQNVRDAFFGRWQGPRATALIERVSRAAEGKDE